MIRKHFGFILERTLVAPLLRILCLTALVLIGTAIWAVWEDGLFRGMTTRQFVLEYAEAWRNSEYFS